MDTPTLRPTLTRPSKPWENFPLYWHPRGYWMCRRGGEDWRYEADANKSYDRYVIDDKAWREGKERPSQGRKRYLLSDAVNLYLTRQKRRHEGGELSDVQYAKCRHELQVELPKAVRLGIPLDRFRATSPNDDGPASLFHKIKRKAVARGLHAAHRHIVIVRAALEYAVSKHLILKPDFGDDFDPPSADKLDKSRNDRDLTVGERSWSVPELRKIVAAAKKLKSPHLHAQILLGLFAGYDSADCSAIPERAVDFDKKLAKFSRAKNGKPRLNPLPKCALDAIRASLRARAAASTDDAKPLLFRTANGTKCNAAKSTSDDHGLLKVGRNDTIGKNFQRLLERIELDRARTGFKSLRAMCRTLLVGSGVDEDLVRVIMGRKFRYPVDDYYIRGELREKLFAAVKHIETSLFPVRQRKSRS